MADIKSIEERSKNMSAIKNKDTKPEIYLRKQLFTQGYRYRKNVKYVNGHPDLYLAKYRTAIFVNGCFWHRHQNCKMAYFPKSRIDFWRDKFNKNVARDLKVHEELVKVQIRCLVIWECTIKKMMRDSEFYEQVLADIDIFLHSDTTYKELYINDDMSDKNGEKSEDAF